MDVNYDMLFLTLNHLFYLFFYFNGLLLLLSYSLGRIYIIKGLDNVRGL